MSHSELTGTHVVPKRELLRGTILAAVVAAVILAVAVLPAEYGIDPTGAGHALGLTKLYAAEVAPAAIQKEASALAGQTPVPKGSTVSAVGEERALTISSRPLVSYRADEMEVVLV